jgi:hypothetical protein
MERDDPVARLTAPNFDTDNRAQLSSAVAINLTTTDPTSISCYLKLRAAVTTPVIGAGVGWLKPLIDSGLSRILQAPRD